MLSCCAAGAAPPRPPIPGDSVAAGAGGGAEPSADGRGGSSAAEGPRLSARLPGVSRGPYPSVDRVWPAGAAVWLPLGCPLRPATLPAREDDPTAGLPGSRTPRSQPLWMVLGAWRARCLYMDRECGSVRARVSSAVPRCQRGFPSAF